MERIRRLALMLLLPMLLLSAGCRKDNNPVATGTGDPDRGETLTGTLSGDLSGVYTIADTVTVPAGQTLTVHPGAEIYFRPGAALNVKGEIQAVGTEDSWITFSSVRSHPDRGDWAGIRLLGADDNSTFEYVRVAYAAKYDLRTDTTRFYFKVEGNDRAVPLYEVYRGAITVRNCSPTIRRCIIELGGYDGIHVIGKSEPMIDHNTIVQNAFNAIHIEPDWSLVDTTEGAPDPLGELYLNVAPSKIYNNVLVENDDAGIRLYENLELYEAGMIPEMSYNDIWNNASLNYVPPSFRDAADVSRDIHVDPVFVDLANGDYTLHPCSGAIDQGDPLETDQDHTRVDMGALPLRQGPHDLAKRLVADEVFDKLNLEAGAVYRVRCDAWVAEGDRLVIGPGTILEFEGPYSLYIYGGIEVSGNQGDEVVFTSAMEEPARADWRQLVLNHADDDSWFEHAIIEYASMDDRSVPTPDTLGALTVIASSPRIDNVTIRESYYAGLYCFDGASPEVDRLAVESIGMHGIACELNSNPMITRSTIHDAGGYGVYLVNNSSPVISNLLMYNLGGSGFYVRDLSSPKVNYTTVYGRSSSAVGEQAPIILRISHGVRAENFARPEFRNSIFCMYKDSGVLSQVSSRPELYYTYLFTDVTAGTIEGNVDTTSLYTDPLEFRNVDGFDFQLPAGSPGKTASEDGREVGAYGPDGNGM